MKNIRLAAAEILLNVVDEGRSLNDELPRVLAEVDPDQHPFLQQLVYGSTRYYFALDELISKIVEKPIKGKERLVHMLLAVGFYQLWQLEVAEHAAINETVEATLQGKKKWAKNLVNASLRRFQRERETLLAELRRTESFPGWLNKRLKAAWPVQFTDICKNSNQLGPMTLRVNAQHVDRDAWLARADTEGLACEATTYSPVGVTLAAPAPVFALPGFENGDVSVQDEAAQMCAALLNVQDGEKVLDACAAPGGKTGHLLESANIEMTALDVDEKRLQRVTENLTRIQQQATLKAADAGNLDDWWNGEQFDAILLDAPCSGTGVIRRHPDIKLLRKSADIKQLSIVQDNLLVQLWKTLKPGGRLLYATCSILPDENSERIEQFLKVQSDAELITLDLAADVETPTGVQWLPQPGGHDGFFYALLRKQIN
jgi:16S rRNA (cytosine967-C5)-methyltransferase